MVESGNKYSDRVSALVNWGHWFTFFNIVAAMLIGTRYIADSPWPETLLGQFYLFVSWVGHFGFLVFILYILILFPLTFIIPSNRLFRMFGVLFATIGLTLLVLDTQAYQSMSLHLNPMVWELLFSDEQSHFNAQWQYLFAIIPIVFLIQVALSEWIWRKHRKLAHKRIGRPISGVFFICFTISHLIYIWADATFYQPIVSQKANFPLSYPMTAKTFLERQGWFDREEYQQKLEFGEEGHLPLVNYPSSVIESNDSHATAYNLLLIRVDSLRADMLTAELMPSLYEFSSNNQLFSNHYSSSNNSYADIGLFYGIPASYALNLKHQNVKPLIFEQLHKLNYTLSMFSSAIEDENNLIANIQGISDFSTLSRSQTDEDAVTYWRAWHNESTQRRWASVIQLSELDRFEEQAQKSSSMADSLKNTYFSSVKSVDTQLSRIFEKLENSQSWDNTIVVITSNHGWEFNETKTNSWGANSNYSQYQLKVPMVIHWPNREAKQYHHITSHVDLSTTLMQGVFGVTSNPNDYGSGQSLFDTTKRPYVFAGDRDDFALITPKYHTIVLDPFGNYKLFDQNYVHQHQAKPKLALIMKGLGETKRFYKDEK